MNPAAKQRAIREMAARLRELKNAPYNGDLFMPDQNPPQTASTLALLLLSVADDLANRHYNGVAQEFESVRAGFVLGYVRGVLHEQSAEQMREACYEALRVRFGWDDDDIAVQIIGG